MTLYSRVGGCCCNPQPTAPSEPDVLLAGEGNCKGLAGLVKQPVEPSPRVKLDETTAPRPPIAVRFLEKLKGSERASRTSNPPCQRKFCPLVSCQPVWSGAQRPRDRSKSYSDRVCICHSFIINPCGHIIGLSLRFLPTTLLSRSQTLVPHVAIWKRDKQHSTLQTSFPSSAFLSPAMAPESLSLDTRGSSIRIE